MLALFGPPQLLATSGDAVVTSSDAPAASSFLLLRFCPKLHLVTDLAPQILTIYHHPTLPSMPCQVTPRSPARALGGPRASRETGTPHRDPRSMRSLVLMIRCTRISKVEEASTPYTSYHGCFGSHTQNSALDPKTRQKWDVVQMGDLVSHFYMYIYIYT